MLGQVNRTSFDAPTKPFSKMLSTFGSKTKVNKEYRCMIRLLDEQDEILECDFQGHHKGQHLMEQVCCKLNLLEKDYFGLRYVDELKQRHWLDPTKNILKQVQQMNPIMFSFRVKFYPKDPFKLREELTRYHIFLQLRRDLQHGRLYCSFEDSAELGAYIVQSEIGDYDPEEHGPSYLSDFRIHLKQSDELMVKIADIHQKLVSGQVPAVAEANFLKKASQLDTYGIDPHPVKDANGDQLYLGINYSGLLTFQGSQKTNHFRWSDIKKLNYEGKMFIVHLAYNERKHTVGFKCPTSLACRHLWRCAVEQRIFFTLSSSEEAPKVVTGGSFFSRGSRFRYSGRTEREMQEMTAGVYRLPPTVSRSASFRNRASLAQQLSPANTSDEEFADGIGFTALRSSRSMSEQHPHHHNHLSSIDGIPMNSPYFKEGAEAKTGGLHPPLSSLAEGSESNRSSAHNLTNNAGARERMKLGRSKDDSSAMKSSKTSTAEGAGSSSPGRDSKGRLTRSASTSSTTLPTSSTQDFQAELKALVEYKTPAAPRFPKFLSDIRKAFTNPRAFNKSFVLPGIAVSVVAVAVLTVVVLECDFGGVLSDFKESQEMVMLQQRYYEPFKNFFARSLFARE